MWKSSGHRAITNSQNRKERKFHLIRCNYSHCSLVIPVDSWIGDKDPARRVTPTFVTPFSARSFQYWKPLGLALKHFELCQSIFTGNYSIAITTTSAITQLMEKAKKWTEKGGEDISAFVPSGRRAGFYDGTLTLLSPKHLCFEQCSLLRKIPSLSAASKISISLFSPFNTSERRKVFEMPDLGKTRAAEGP